MMTPTPSNLLPNISAQLAFVFPLRRRKECPGVVAWRISQDSANGEKTVVGWNRGEPLFPCSVTKLTMLPLCGGPGTTESLQFCSAEEMRYIKQQHKRAKSVLSFSFGCSCSIWKFPVHGSTPRCHRDNAGSLTWNSHVLSFSKQLIIMCKT